MRSIHHPWPRFGRSTRSSDHGVSGGVLRAGAALLFLFPTISGIGSAQVALQQFNGAPNGNTSNQYGRSVAAIGDVDGDQVQDFLAGAPYYATGTCSGNARYQRGFVRVVSGASGITIREHYGRDLGCNPYYNPIGGTRMGMCVSSVGDLDADGVPDYLVSSDRENQSGSGTGRVTAYSGVSGDVIFHVDGVGGGDLFGNWVSGVGDVDDDDVPDFAVTAPYSDQPLRTDCGSVTVISGGTGSTIATFHGETPGARMIQCSRVGDVNFDGHDDVLVGAFLEDTGSLLDNGRATVFSGAAPFAPLLVFEGSANDEHLGHRVAGAGDLDGDGYPDMLVSLEGASPRVVRVYDTFGAAITDVVAPASSVSFGATLAGVGDVDGNGKNDFLIADPGWNGGEGIVYLYNLKPNGTPRLISTLPAHGAETGGNFGYAARGVGHWDTTAAAWVDGDWNGDGLDDVVIGATHEYFSRGRVSVYSGVCLDAENFCTSTPNSSGAAATIGYQGSLSLDGADLVLTAQDCPPNKAGIFYYGPLQIQAPFGCGYKCVGGTVHRLPLQLTDGAGSASMPIDYAVQPSITVGSTWSFQFWFRDPNGCQGGTVNLSDGLTGTFCP